jgi:hypothetical protein
MRLFIMTVALVCSAQLGLAQSWDVEGHGTYGRTTQSHQNSWGAGAMLAGTWGGKSAPVQLGMSVGGDWLAQENNGPTQWSISYEPTLQAGGGHALSPYVGGSVNANWLSGNTSSSGALLGLQWIFGVQFKPESQGPLSMRLEARPGYVRTQEHSVSWRFGMSWSL